MSKTRLNQRMRDVLGHHARKLVAAPSAKAAVEATYKDAAGPIRKMIEARYPPKDMAVLKRYDQARDDLCVRLQLTPGGFHVWNFHKDDKVPLQPGRGCQTYVADELITIAVQAHVVAMDGLKSALEKKLNDYYSLIAAVTTFEAVCEVWPEAEAVRSQCGGQALVVAVTPDVVERIKADIASRVREVACPPRRRLENNHERPRLRQPHRTPPHRV